jgi:hypothetical protein
LTLGNHCIGHSGFCGRQLELDAVISDCSRQHFGRYRVAFAVEATTWSPGVIIAGCGKVVLERNRLRTNGGQLCRRRTEAQGIGARLIRREGRDQRSAAQVRRLLLFFLFLGIDFAGGDDRPGEGDAHILRWMTVELDHAENDFVIRFRFLESEHANSGVVEVKQRKSLAQRTGMLCRLEGDQRIAETIGLPVRLRLFPTAGVSRQAEYEFVMTPVLVCLVAVPLRASIGWRLHSGRA